MASMKTDRVAAVRHLCLEGRSSRTAGTYFTSWMPIAPAPWMGPPPTGPELM
jgi:hypothetical protein